ncbi:phage tail spike protein [Ruminococcus sp.]|uniref:phage tail spike protein n=1 Tax=Ruminococcus sp. TaxID=41978 RepID=UPI001B6E0D51|nr:phage tail spike protein [Ruminococcus sp.]MBP5434140.1 phage tail protein [Ruminococcus sp.]
MYRITINGQLLHEPDTQSRYRLSSGRIDDEVNQIPKFTFRIPVSNPRYEDELNDRKDIIEVTNTLTNEVEFEGTLLTHTDSMSNAGKLTKGGTCEGYLGYLCDSIQPYHHYENSTVTEFLTALLAVHNANVSQDKQISLGSCDISGDNTNSKTTAYRNTLEEIRVNLIERIGGEIRIRKVNGSLVLDFMTQIGSRSSTKIQLADNIVALSVDTDSTNIITRLIPLGYQLHPEETAERLTIATVNSDCIYLDDTNAIDQFGVIEGTVIFDDITVPANLKAAGQDYLTNNNRIRKAYQAQVLDLSTINNAYTAVKCGWTYPFLNEYMDINEELRVMRRSVDIYKPYAPTIEIGDRAERITDIATRTAKLIEYELPKQKLDILASAKATATELINAGINGYVVVNGNEILIMDTPDKSTATKVWRWNSGGFGYSNNGYSGPYDTAITMNGAIVADFITAGVLRGLEIINGNGTFHVDTNGNVTASSVDINNGNGIFRVLPNGTVQASALQMTGGSINMSTSTETYDAITLSCNEWTLKLEPLQVILSNSSIDKKILIQAGAIYMYDSINAQQAACVIEADGDIATTGMIAATGSISSQAAIHGDSLLFEQNGNTYNVGTLISALWNEVFGGGM